MGRTGLFLVFMGILFLMPLTALAASAGKMVSKGNTAYAAGKYDEALKAYEEASVVAPESARIYFNKGAAYYRQGDYTRAIEAFENAALNNRDGVIDARARFNLGNCAFRVAEGQKDHDPRQALDAYKKSIRHFQEALERDAGFTEAAENIEVVRLIMKSVLDEIKKQEEAAQKEQSDAENTAEKIKQLIEDQQALLDRNIDLSTREREDGADDALQGKRDDLSDLSVNQTNLRDKTRDFLESMLKEKQNPLDPARPPEVHMENAVTEQDNAIEELENNRAASAQPNQLKAVEELEKALASLDEKENQKEQGKQPEEGQPQPDEPSGQDPARDEQNREQDQAAGVQFPDDAQNILDEEKENQKRRRLPASGGYREVDKDW